MIDPVRLAAIRQVINSGRLPAVGERLADGGKVVAVHVARSNVPGRRRVCTHLADTSAPFVWLLPREEREEVSG
jgi:hypothetical protein